MNTIKTIAAPLITILALTGTAQAAERLPDELLGCWKWSHASGGNRAPDANYTRVSSKDCTGDMLISSDRYGGDYGYGEINCRLHNVVFSDTKRGRYQFLFQCRDNEPIFTSTMTLRGNKLTVRETP